MVVEEFKVTTVDNPFSPFSQWDEWYAYDERMGYHTTSFIARLASYSDELSELDQIEEMNRVVEEIIRYNVLGIYKKVSKETSLSE